MKTFHEFKPEFVGKWAGEKPAVGDNVVPMTGAQTPPNTPWLDELGVGQSFVCRGTSLTSPLYEYTLVGRHKPSGIALLRENLIQGKEDYSEQQWYLSSYFCSIFNLITTLE